MGEELRVKLLGMPAAFVGDEPVSGFVSIKAQALLFYLAATGEIHQRDALAALLWGDVPGVTARKNLRDVLSNLRRLIGPFLLITRYEVGLHPDAPIKIDSQYLLRAVSAVRKMELAPVQAPANLHQILGEVADPGMGEFLAGFYAPDAPLFEEWMLAEREHLRMELGNALESLTEYSLALEDYAAAEAYARRQLELDNYRESAHRQLMIALALTDRRAEAAAHYKALVDLLWNDLSLEPADTTQALMGKIQAGETIPVTIIGKPAAPTDNLPLRLASFVGRQEEMETIAGLIAQARLVTLTGVGGIGKTELCLQVGRALLDEYPDGVWQVELAPVADPGLVPQTAASALGLWASPEQSVLDTLLNFLREKQCLLILDNCEHLIGATAQLSETLLQSCPEVKILASSREAFSISGETLYVVPSLGFPDGHKLLPPEEWNQYDAIQLFVDRAATVLPGFQVTKDNFASVVHICRQLDGIPLALELAAARVNALTIAQIAARLDDRFRLLSGGSRTGLVRHQTLRAMIDWSWDLLDNTEKLLLQRLSVFTGGMAMEAVEVICAGDGLDARDLLDLMSDLVNKSLVITWRKQGKKARYRLLETIRQYARERLRAAGREEIYRDRHLDYYLNKADLAEKALVGPDQASWHKWLDRELDNIRAALSWALAVNIESGLCLATSIWRFWDHSYPLEGEAWMAQLLAHPEPVVPAIKAKALWVHSRFTFYQFNIDNAKRLAEESLAIYQELGDQHGAAQAHFIRAFVETEWEEVETGLLNCLTIFRELGDKVAIADVLVELAVSETDYELSMTHIEESELLCREVGHLAGLAEALTQSGLLAIRHGEYDYARLKLEESLMLEKSLGPGRRVISINLGLLYYRQGDYQQARVYLEQGLSTCQRTGLTMIGYWAMAFLGYVLLRAGEINQALEILELNLQQFKGVDYTIGVVFATEGLASLAVHAGQFARAARLFAWADTTRESIQNTRPPVEQADVDRDIAVIQERLGEEAYAAACAEGRKMTMEQAIAKASEIEIAQHTNPKPATKIAG